MHSPKLSAKRVHNSQFNLRGNRMQSQFYFPYNFPKRRSASALALASSFLIEDPSSENHFLPHPPPFNCCEPSAIENIGLAT